MGSIYLYVSISFFALDLGLFKGDEKYGLVNAYCSPAANTRNTWFDLVVDLFPFDLRMVNFDNRFSGTRVSVLESCRYTRYWTYERRGLVQTHDHTMFRIDTQETSMKNN